MSKFKVGDRVRNIEGFTGIVNFNALGDEATITNVVGNRYHIGVGVVGCAVEEDWMELVDKSYRELAEEIGVEFTASGFNTDLSSHICYAHSKASYVQAALGYLALAEAMGDDDGS